MTAAPKLARSTMRSEIVTPLNLGLYLDRPRSLVPPGGLLACLNVRIKYSRVVSGQLGYEPFLTSPPNLDPPLNDQTLLIDQFFLRDGTGYLIFGTRWDLYYYNTSSKKALFITPIYNTGTVTNAVYNGGDDETTITGSGTAWDSAPTVKRGGSTNKNARVDDYYFPGDSQENDPTASSWFPVKQVNSDTEIIVEGDASGVTGDYTIRQTFSGSNSHIWSSDVFPNALPSNDDIWYAVNGFEWVKWTETAAAAADPAERLDPGFTARVLTFFKNMLVAGNIQVGSDYLPGSFRNSQIALPEEWSDDEAHQQSATAGIDELLAFSSLGDALISYHDRSVNVIQFVDLPVIWAVRTAVSGFGPLSTRALMGFGDYDVFLAADTQYRFDGINLTDVNGHVFREVLRQIDPNRLYQTLAHIDEENGDLIWVVPLTVDAADSPEIAYQSHYLEKVGKRPTPMTRRQLPATATGFYEQSSAVRWSDISEQWQNYNYRWNDRFFAAAFPFNLFGDENGNVFKMNTCESLNGEDLVSYARVARFAGYDSRNKGMLMRVEPFTSDRPAADYDLLVKTYAASSLDADAVLKKTSTKDLTGTERKKWVNPRVAGRFFEIEFGTAEKNQPWEVAGFGYDVLRMGI